MIMNRISLFFALLMLTLSSAVVCAQEVSPVDFMRLNPYQLKSNPAADLPYESVMSMVIGNIGLNVQTTTLRYDNIFDFDASGRPAAVNLKKLANSLHDNNFIGIDVNENFFSLYRRVGEGMFTYDHNVKAHGALKYNDGLFQLLANGNAAFVGDNNPAHVDMNLDATVYHEFSVGYQRKVNDNLSVGGRAKLLFGFANVTTDVCDAKLFTDADTYALSIEENVGARMSLPNMVFINNKGMLDAKGPLSVGDFFHNPGFGVDFGAEYHFNDQLGAVAAVNDLGFIHWGGNDFKLDGDIHDAGQFYDNGSFLYEGIHVDQLQHIFSDKDYREKFFDTIQQYFQVQLNSMENYTTMLNTNLLLRGYYDFTPQNRVVAQAQGRFIGNGFRPAFTVAYCGTFFDNLNVCATYTAMPHSYDNIGLGLSAMIETCNIYLTTNNLVGLFKPLNTSAFNAQVGVVFNLFKEGRHTIDESGRPGYL